MNFAVNFIILAMRILRFVTSEVTKDISQLSADSNSRAGWWRDYNEDIWHIIQYSHQSVKVLYFFFLPCDILAVVIG